MKTITAHQLAKRLRIDPGIVVRDCKTGALATTRPGRSYLITTPDAVEYDPILSASEVAAILGHAGGDSSNVSKLLRAGRIDGWLEHGRGWADKGQWRITLSAVRQFQAAPRPYKKKSGP